MEPLDNHLASPVKGAAQQMATDHGVISASKVGMEMEIRFAIFLGNIADEA